MIAQYDIRVFVSDYDFYARQSMVSYLSWERRTRVVGSVSTPFELLCALREGESAPHVILFGTSFAGREPKLLIGWLEAVYSFAPNVQVICMARQPSREMALAASEAGAIGFLTHDSVGFSLARAVLHALESGFLITQDVAERLEGVFDGNIFRAQVLPRQRTYPALTNRIRQAIHLCVLEGLPAELAAIEMGLSTNTVRSYIKEGYRILELHNDTFYPNQFSAQERAFLRYTALESVN